MSYALNKANQILAEKNEKLIPENIRAGVQIFDVIGSMNGAEGNTVKVFEDRDEVFDYMNTSYETINSGETFLVYGKEVLQSIADKEKFNSIYLPETIVLEKPMTVSPTGDWRAEFESGGMHGSLYITPQCIYHHFSGSGSADPDAYIEYLSEDGQTFTRQRVELYAPSSSYYADRKFVFDETTQVLTLQGSTTKYYFEVVNDPEGVIPQIYKKYYKQFDGLYNTVKGTTYALGKISLPTSYYFGDISTLTPAYAYIGNIVGDEGNRDLFGELSETKNYQGYADCEFFDTLYWNKNASNIYCILDGDNVHFCHQYSYANTNTESFINQTRTLYIVRDSIVEVKEEAFNIKDNVNYPIRYNNGSYEYVYIPFCTAKKSLAKILRRYSATIYFRNINDLSTNIKSTSINDGGTKSHTIAYYEPAPNNLSLALSNQLLPGIKAYGSQGVIEGTESIYDNLQTTIIDEKFFNLEKITEDAADGYNHLPSKFYTNAGANDKQTFVNKVNETENLNSYYLAETNIEYNPCEATVFYDRCLSATYIPEYNIIISQQETNTVNHYVIEDATTHEKLLDNEDTCGLANISSGYSSAYYMAHNLYRVYSYTSSDDKLSKYKIDMYSYKDKTVTTIFEKTLTYNTSNSFKSFDAEVVNKDYFGYYLTYADNSTTVYSNVAFVNDKEGKVIKLLENATINKSSATSSISNGVSVVEFTDYFYIYCVFGEYYSGSSSSTAVAKKAYLFKFDKGTEKITTVRAGSLPAVSTSYPGQGLAAIHGFECDGMLLIGECLIGLADATKDTSNVYYKLTVNGSVIHDTFLPWTSRPNPFITINGDEYFVSYGGGGHCYKVKLKSITWSSSQANLLIEGDTKALSIPASVAVRYKNKSGIVGSQTLYIDTFNITVDDNLIYNVPIDPSQSNNLFNFEYNDLKFIGVDKVSSQSDYDYNIYKTGAYAIVQKQCNSL